jgi:hypothetical protein
MSRHPLHSPDKGEKEEASGVAAIALGQAFKQLDGENVEAMVEAMILIKEGIHAVLINPINRITRTDKLLLAEIGRTAEDYAEVIKDGKF